MGRESTVCIHNGKQILVHFTQGGEWTEHAPEPARLVGQRANEPKPQIGVTERANSGGSARSLSDIVIVKYQKFGGVDGVFEVVLSHLLPDLTLTLTVSTNQKPHSEASPAPRTPR